MEQEEDRPWERGCGYKYGYETQVLKFYCVFCSQIMQIKAPLFVFFQFSLLMEMLI